MDIALYTAASGSLANQMRLEVLSNNLANLNTVGYKEDRSSFQSWLPGVSKIKGDSTKDLSLPINYDQANIQVAFEGTRPNFNLGDIKYTGNSLDIALDGKGFFRIETPNGTQYTKKGNFQINGDGFLANQEGFPVMGDNGPIIIKGKEIMIDELGNITVEGQVSGRISVINFGESANLEKAGDTSFVTSDSKVNEIPAQGVKVKQGYLELSNVNGMRVVMEMIEVLRAFESYQKMIHSIDDLNEQAISKVGKIA